MHSHCAGDQFIIPYNALLKAGVGNVQHSIMTGNQKSHELY